MYKNILAVLAVLLLSATLSGCTGSGAAGNTTETTASTTASTTAVTTSASPVETTQTTAPATNSPAVVGETVTVSFDTYHFSLTLPASWEGAYATAETSRGVTFYELQNHLYNARGKLFSILFIAEEDYQEGMYPSYYDLGSYDGKRAVWLGVTDVQYEETLKAPYQALSDQLDAVRASFVYTA
ncbi:MAG: hypothetical protein ACI39E_05595 [Acutalibacteraceae bacterium]